MGHGVRMEVGKSVGSRAAWVNYFVSVSHLECSLLIQEKSRGAWWLGLSKVIRQALGRKEHRKASLKALLFLFLSCGQSSLFFKGKNNFSRCLYPFYFNLEEERGNCEISLGTPA